MRRTDTSSSSASGKTPSTLPGQPTSSTVPSERTRRGGGGPVVFQGDGADGVAGEGRNRCRLSPLAPHVPDGAEPPGIDGVYQVVEVPPHIVGRPDGEVLGANLDTR